MSKCRKRNRHSTRLARVERKCDLILSELLVIRQRIGRRTGIDSLIDRLHASARNMRRQCEIERDFIHEMFNPKS